MSNVIQVPGGRAFQLSGVKATRALPGRAVQQAASSRTWKTTELLASGSVKTVLGLARASIKTFQGLTP